MHIIITGVKTRLASALLKLKWEKDAISIAARNQKEAEWIADNYPGKNIILPDEKDSSKGIMQKNVAIMSCAVGLIHPAEPELEKDLKRFHDDITLIDRLLTVCSGKKIHVVFVSSILALVPKKRHFYYRGWKCISEALVQSLASKQADIQLSVLYPGRLVEHPSWIHTHFSRLAEKMQAAAQSDQSIYKVVGLDSRLMLLWKSVYLTAIAAFGRL